MGNLKTMDCQLAWTEGIWFSIQDYFFKIPVFYGRFEGKEQAYSRALRANFTNANVLITTTNTRDYKKILQKWKKIRAQCCKQALSSATFAACVAGAADDTTNRD